MANFNAPQSSNTFGFDPNSAAKGAGTAYDLFNQYQQAQQNTLKALYAPQQLFAEALAKKIDLAHQMAPVDYDLIRRASTDQLNAQRLAQGLPPIPGGSNDQSSQAPSQTIDSEQALRPKNVPAGVSQQGLEMLKGAGASSPSGQPGSPGGSAPTATAPAQPSAQAAPPTVDLSDPMALPRMSQNIPASAIMNPMTAEMMKSTLASGAQAIRMAPSANAGFYRADEHARTAPVVAEINAKAKTDTQAMKNNGDNSPYKPDPKDSADFYQKVMGEFDKKPYTVNQGSLVAAIDSLKPDKAAFDRAMGNPTYKKIYEQAKGIQTGIPIQPQPPAQIPSNYAPASPGSLPSPVPSKTPSQVEAQTNSMNAFRAGVHAAGFPQLIDPNTHQTKFQVPLSVWTAESKRLLEHGVTSQQIMSLKKEILVGP